MSAEDTIVAVATPPGRGGIGVVRLSGDRAVEIATSLVRFSSAPLEARHATLGELRDTTSGRTLDRVVVTCFPRPHSYTAEDVVEISCHGSPVILKHLVECALERGARAAEPGEFTLRAFLNGRIDLTQAEAIRDLIESRTLYQARVAAQQMEGAVSARLKPHKKALVDLIARLEAGIDFAEDDVPVEGWDTILASLGGIRVDLEKLVEGYGYGRIIREGLSLAIVGRPNVGKSSLFNRLLNEERALVTPVPGTTRDLVTESASVGGIPLRFVDTAGVRETTDLVETLGIEKTLKAIADSDLRLLVVDASQPWTEEDSKLLAKVQPQGALLVACNKSDLGRCISTTEIESLAAPEAAGPPSGIGATARITGLGVVWTSALTGAGLPELRERILNLAAGPHQAGSDGELITNLRHRQLLKVCIEALGQAHTAAAKQVPHELLLLDLYDALHALDEITGATTVEDVLGVIFSKFCVGK
ncbi:MAG TPA: tRNA uridine-5-carboxymethylaminomethyl(34) synthesis GTPase MnmE [Terriglobia bacterium]|nr:tRNA uridine-5-carboxymethylaminomethyl(34) synthesis GTPase MnmE [Terriglobia bacterium]